MHPKESGAAAVSNTEEGLLEMSSATKFKDLPLSERTKKGLKEANFLTMTEIQRSGIPHALAGRDILGTAKTGSGKTLAFVIPLLESLYREKWTSRDGLGALILSPTRELAIQTFQVLVAVGKFHGFSAGLVVGGHNVQEEARAIGQMNILIATPGRFVQHLSSRPDLYTHAIRVLVLDEADRMLDIGFKKDMTAILDELPPSDSGRQTMLFSATQSPTVLQFSRLSLHNPQYINVHEKSESSLPQKLRTYYITVSLPQKLSALFFFLRTHAKDRILVFTSTVKMARFVTMALSHLRPGLPIRSIHGRMNQQRRELTIASCGGNKPFALVCTDMAARGLDFSQLTWVLHWDVPDSVETYIHRSGRSARYRSTGSSLLFLLPSESAFVQHLEDARVPIQSMKLNESRLSNITPKLQALLIRSPETKYCAMKAFVTYVRGYFRQTLKDVFLPEELPLNDFAQSMGLLSAPKIKVTGSTGKAHKDSVSDSNSDSNSDSDSDADSSSGSSGTEDSTQPELAAKSKSNSKSKTRMDRLFKKTNQDVLSEHYSRLVQGEEEEGSENDSDGRGDGLFEVVRKDHQLSEEEDNAAPLFISKTKKKKLLGKNTMNIHTHTKFGGEDLLGEESEELRESVGELREKMKVRDAEDKQRIKEEKKAKRWEEKEKRRQLEGGTMPVAQLGGVSDSEAELERSSISENDDSDSGNDSDSDEGEQSEYDSATESDDAPEGGKRHSLEDSENLALRILKKRKLAL